MVVDCNWHLKLKQCSMVQILTVWHCINHQIRLQAQTACLVHIERSPWAKQNLQTFELRMKTSWEMCARPQSFSPLPHCPLLQQASFCRLFVFDRRLLCGGCQAPATIANLRRWPASPWKVSLNHEWHLFSPIYRYTHLSSCNLPRSQVVW